MRPRRRTWLAFVVPLVCTLVGGAPQATHAAEAAWQEPVRLSASGRLVHAATAGDASALAWTEAGSIFVAYRASQGPWETAELGEGARPRVAVNAKGMAVVVWQQPAVDGVEVKVSVRPPAATWTEPTTVTSAGGFPRVAVNESGTIRVLALRWRVPTPAMTDVELFTYDDEWGQGRVLNRRPLPNTVALRRSLKLKTDASGRAVVAWLCPAAGGLSPRDDPRRQGWVCLHFRGSTDVAEPASNGRYAISVPRNSPIHLATSFMVSEVEPGFVYGEGWTGRRTKVSRVSLDVARNGDGVAAWRGAGQGGALWASTRHAERWGKPQVVADPAHGLSGATFADPGTALAFWRTASGRLATASTIGRSTWHTDRSRLGQEVERARLVSNLDGDALLAWSSSAPGGAGVYVSVRPRA